MTRHVDFLLVGGGPASATAADTLRQESAQGTILIITEEPIMPYCRPPLSKQFLLGTQTRGQIDIFSEADYERLNIELLLGTRAIHVDPKGRVLNTDRAGSIHYGQLLIATGSRPKRLDVPGDSLPGVYYLRTLADAEALKEAAEGAKHAVVVGGSFIGMELASSLRQKGVAVTLIAEQEILLDRLQTPVISAFFLQYFHQRGVEILFKDTVRKFYGKGRMEGVVTRAGRNLPCDLVAVGIGVTPNTEFLTRSGIIIDNGIVVDQYLQTNKAHIFAAGDVANFFDPVFGGRWRVDHWDNAVKQGRLAAKNMLGLRQAYNECSYFFSDIFDLSFEFFGDINGVNEWVERGSLADRSFALFYLKDDIPRALFTIGRPPQETKATESLIRNRVNLETLKDKLSDPGYPLEDIPAQTVLILQGGGAMGAYECGVVKALEEKGIYPDIVAGVSIGAFNAAIIAGNPGHATAAIEAFWNDLALDTPDVSDEVLRRMISSSYSLLFGSPQFFQPRWFKPILNLNDLPPNWTSFYDPTPVKDLLRKYINFTKLKASPVRLLVNVVNVETAELETFDSRVDDLTPDHILASGCLPPGFPWVKVNDKYYWDGGIVSNSPLDQVVEHCGVTGKRVFIVDLYPSRKPLPNNLMGVIARRDEVIYSEKIRKDVRSRDLIHDIRRLIDEILNSVEPMTAGQIKQRPHYIQVMGDLAPMMITRIVNESGMGDLQAKDYDFSRRSIENLKQEGYQMTIKALGRLILPMH